MAREHVDESSPLLREGDSNVDARPWWRRPNPYMLYPMFALQCITSSMMLVSSPNLLVNLACNMNFDLDMNIRDPRCHDPKIQEKVSAYDAVLAMMAGFLSAWVLPRLSGISDRYGRKISMFYNVIMAGFAYLAFIVVQIYWKHLVYGVITIPFFLLGLSGTEMLMFIAMTSYIADCCKQEDRTGHVSMLVALGLGGGVVGPFMVGYLSSKVDNILASMYVVMLITVIILVFIAVIPESLSNERMQHHRMEFEKTPAITWKESILDAFNIAKPIKIIWNTAKAQPYLLKRNILALVVCEILYLGVMNFKLESSFLYFQLKFDWSTEEIGFFQSLTYGAKAFMLAVVIPVSMKALSYIMREHNTSGISRAELAAVRLGLVSEVVGCLGFAVARNGSQTLAIGMIESIGAISKPTIQAAFLNIVPEAHLGDFLGAKGAIVVLFAILSATSGLSVYSASVGSIPYLIFLIAAAAYAITWLVSYWIKPYVGLESGESEHDDVTA